MGKRKAASQEDFVARKKVTQDDSAVTTPTFSELLTDRTAQQQATLAPTIAPPTMTETSITVPPTMQPKGENIAPTQLQAARGSVIDSSGMSKTAALGAQGNEEAIAQSSSGEPVASATAATNGKKTTLEPDILKQIFYEIIIRGPPDSTPGHFGTPWHFTGFKHSVINCAARATLRGVCKLWADLIDDEINLWRYIHIDGKCIPSPPRMRWWGREAENYLELWHRRQVVNIVGEMPRATLSLERSQESFIDLVLVDPSYHSDSECWQPLLARPGLLEFIDAAMVKPMIGSLSISTEDIHFVKDLFDPEVHSYKRRRYDEGMEKLTDAKKVSLACDGEETDHFDLSTLPPSSAETFNGARTRTQRQIEEANKIEHASLRKKFKVWPALHTLRICIKGDTWINNLDQERCALPAERSPVLRHLELELHKPELYIKHPLWLWTFPYPQLTHLTLVTEEQSSILLGIIARCTLLESLTITLRHQDPEVHPTVTVEHHILALLKKLSVQIDVTSVRDPKVGRLFLDHISTPRLQSLEAITSNVDRAYPIVHLLTRSQCQLRELRLDFSSSALSGRRDGASDTDRFNLRELLYLVSPNLDTLAIQSGSMDNSWLEDFSAPHLKKFTVLCFGVSTYVHKMEEPDDASVAHDVALYVLRWAEEWMKVAPQEENSNRSIAFVAGSFPSMCHFRDGTEAFYGRTGYFQCEQVRSPDTVNTMVSRIRTMGGKINVVWTTVRMRTHEEQDVWCKQKEED
ncbi:hypothetical protein DFP72DRAFT_1150231 [Ephemerocybe angulata]|uniref:F-box domain-containing protein n=1 Tax=Ephemerocybe angulata TaxID=980116 RepID=A0A8H6HH54_9AGAR|nr:hypothetical protein DFP72DRAFT_1150231 [Tulosesus angulatus]